MNAENHPTDAYSPSAPNLPFKKMSYMQMAKMQSQVANQIDRRMEQLVEMQNRLYLLDMHLRV